MAVVWPFAGGAVTLLLTVTWPLGWRDPTVRWPVIFFSVVIAWGVAGCLLVGVKVREALARWLGRGEAVARAWWLAMVAGAADVCLLAGAAGLTMGRPAYRYGMPQEARAWLAVAAEAGIHFGWAALLTRRAGNGDSGG